MDDTSIVIVSWITPECNRNKKADDYAFSTVLRIDVQIVIPRLIPHYVFNRAVFRR